MIAESVYALLQMQEGVKIAGRPNDGGVHPGHDPGPGAQHLVCVRPDLPAVPGHRQPHLLCLLSNCGAPPAHHLPGGLPVRYHQMIKKRNFVIYKEDRGQFTV